MIWTGTFNGSTYNLIGENPITGISGLKGYFGTTDITDGVNTRPPNIVSATPNLIVLRDPEFLGELRIFGSGLSFQITPLQGGLGSFPQLTAGTITGLQFYFNEDLDRTLNNLATPGLTASEIQVLEAQRVTFSNVQFLDLGGPPDAVLSLPAVSAAQLGQSVIASYNTQSAAPLQAFFDQFQFSFTGTNNNNTLRGTSNSDVLVGLGGNDQLEGAAGNDTLDGGTGVNVLNGGPGSDLYFLGLGTNSIGENVLNTTDVDTVSYRFAPTGAKIVLDAASLEQPGGAAANDTILGVEVAIGTQFDDELVGRVAATVDWDRLVGLAGDDILRSGPGEDVLEGGIGFDFLDGGTGGGNVFAGEPLDRAVWAAAPGDVHIFLDQFNRLLIAAPGEGLDTVINVERFEFSGQVFGPSQLTLSNANLVVGDDQGRGINGTVGVDIIFGRGGNDTILAGAANDVVEGGKGNDSISGGNNADMLYGESGDDDLGGGAGNDLLVGGPGNDQVNGDGGTDTAGFSAAFANYLIDRLGPDSYRVTDFRNGSPDGIDAVSGVEFLKFADQTVSVEDAVTPGSASVFAETGTLVLSHVAQTVTLRRSYDNPVAVAFVATENGAQPVSVRITGVSGTDLTLRLQEPNNLDGAHINETVNYLVVEAGTWVLPDGTLLEAGTLDSRKLSSQGFETVAFDAAFDSAPVILSQVQSFNGADFVTTRQGGADAAGVELTMQEEEALNGGGHVTETIGWVALEGGGGTAGEVGWVAGRASGVTDSTATVGLGTSMAGGANVIAALSSFAGPDPAWARGSGSTGSSFDVSAEEDTSQDAETTHISELVDYIAFDGAGTLSAAPMQDVMEAGTATLNHTAQTITLQQSYDAPVVIAHVASENGAQPVNVRVSGVTGDQLTLQLQEPNYLDGAHANETVNYLVVEAGTWVLPDGTLLEAGTTSSNKLSPQGFEAVAFDAPFDATPVILSQVQSFDGADFVTTRQHDTDVDGFQLTMQEEETNNSGGHVTETLGWVAIEAGGGSAGAVDWQAGSSAGVTHAPATVGLGAGFDGDANVIAALSSFAGPDPAWARGAGSSATDFTISAEEDQSLDAETGHAPETVDYFAFDTPGLFSAYDYDLFA